VEENSHYKMKYWKPIYGHLTEQLLTEKSPDLARRIEIPS